MIYLPYLQNGDAFPSVETATPEGIVCMGGDLSPTRLLSAYRQGIFPWFNEHDPILWWSPDPRCVLYPKNFKRHRSLQKRIRNARFTVRFDTNFGETIRNCQKVDNRIDKGTWIVPQIIEAFEVMHTLGYAHSVEVYQDDILVGGLYGLSLGKAFFGESMFSKEKDASKVALSALVDFCIAHEFDFIDAQVSSNHLLFMGAQNIPRKRFISELTQSLKHPTLQGSWEDMSYLQDGLK